MTATATTAYTILKYEGHLGDHMLVYVYRDERGGRTVFDANAYYEPGAFGHRDQEPLNKCSARGAPTESEAISIIEEIAAARWNIRRS